MATVVVAVRGHCDHVVVVVQWLRACVDVVAWRQCACIIVVVRWPQTSVVVIEQGF